jgi:hypothetical protein
MYFPGQAPIAAKPAGQRAPLDTLPLTGRSTVVGDTAFAAEPADWCQTMDRDVKDR